MNETSVIYEKCAHCWHFIEDNSAWGDYHGLAEYVHLDDGEKEHDHDAIPSGDRRTMNQWQAAHPELFIMHQDDKIGPNSAHFPRQAGIRLPYMQFFVQQSLERPAGQPTSRALRRKGE